jgi:hypothetical protein
MELLTLSGGYNPMMMGMPPMGGQGLGGMGGPGMGGGMGGMPGLYGPPGGL